MGVEWTGYTWMSPELHEHWCLLYFSVSVCVHIDIYIQNPPRSQELSPPWHLPHHPYRTPEPPSNELGQGDSIQPPWPPPGQQREPPCFSSSILKPIPCHVLKKQRSKAVSTGGCSIYGCSFSICIITLSLLTQSCFPLSPPPIFLLHTCFQSIPSAPPVIPSSLLLLPQTH